MSEKKLTGGANWMPQVAPTSWGTPGAPMVRTAWTLHRPPPPMTSHVIHGVVLLQAEFRAVPLATN